MEHSVWARPIEKVTWSDDPELGPVMAADFSELEKHDKSDYMLPANSARAYILMLPANGGWEHWTKASFYAIPIGGERAATDVPWNLFWLDSPA